MSGNIAQRYVRQDDLTDPGDLRGAYDDLPDSVARLRDVVSGLIIHVAWAERYGIPPDMPMVRQTQPVAKRLQQIQTACPGSLRAARPPHKRTFHVEVSWDGGTIRGEGRSIKAAETAAAREALKAMQCPPGDVQLNREP